MQTDPTPDMIIAVGRLGDLNAHDWLQRLTKGRSPSLEHGQNFSQKVKFSARVALSALDPDHRITRFEELLKGPFSEEWMEVQVVREMAAMGDSRLIPLFMTLTATGKNKHVVRSSVEHLGEMRARQAVPVLLDIVDRPFDPDSHHFITSYSGVQHRGNVYKALETISGEEFGDDKARWESWWKAQPESALR